MMFFGKSLVTLCLTIVGVNAACYDVSPAFPVPSWTHDAAELAPAFARIEERLAGIVSDKKYDGQSFSIELTSNTDTLWSHFRTARKRNESRPGATHVDRDSMYRIASISKTFTVLGILYQHKAGNLSLDDSILKYIPDLEGELPWKDITLRILASQLSGIPREITLSDLINEFHDPTSIGLPPATKDGLPKCDQYDENKIPCNRTDLLSAVKKQEPVFAPNFRSTYSNVAFELLGLVLEKVTGLEYKTYMKKAIFDPLEMKSTTLDKPSDEHAVIPSLEDEDNFWDYKEGVQDPTGGIYSCSYDMSKYLRYILTHFNTLATGVNWFTPASWTDSPSSFYGMPWEIFRTNQILTESKRSVNFITKSGGLPSYYSRIFLMPEYGLGITALVGGTPALLSEIQEVVTVEIIRSAEAAIWNQVAKTYDGTFFAIDKSLDSSLVFESSPARGLTLTSFISNGTDVLEHLLSYYIDSAMGGDTKDWYVQLTPTLLFKDEEAGQGEIWRFVLVPERKHGDPGGKVWDEACHSDIDTLHYAGLAANEIVFWHEDGIVELPAWKVKMKTERESIGQQALIVQD